MKIIYADNVFGDALIEETRYREKGFTYVEASSIEEDALIQACADASAVVTCYAQITPRLIQALPKQCRLIIKAGMGVNNINIPAATKRGIMVANVQKYCLDEVSDHAIALALTLIRKTAYMDRLCRKGVWDPIACRPIPRIRDMTFCLYGFGGIARYIARKGRAFGFRMAAYDPFLPDEVFAEEGTERIQDEAELFRRADVLAVQLNLTGETEGIISYEKLCLMKPSAIFINTGRGGLVDEPGLLRALQEGALGGAGLDVLADEKPDMAGPLFQLENVCVTPHIGYYSTESDADLRNKTCDQVIDALTGKIPEFILNRKELGI